MGTRRALLTLPLAVLAAGCSTQPAATAQPGSGQPASEQPVSGLSASGGGSPSVTAAPPVPKTLRFSGTTLDGTAYDAAQLAGKPAVLWFWAPWCATCASEAQSVADFHEEYAARLTFLGIAGMGTTKAMHEFVSDLGVGAVTHLNDPAGKIWSRFGIAQQSTYVLLDTAGKIVTRSYLDDLQLTEALRKLVS